MSTVKISELPLIPRLNPDTTQTLFAGVDLEFGVTGKMTAKVLAQSLYSNDVLNVGNNEIVFPGVVAQFVGEDESYLQLNLQNLSNTGSGDIVITADDGTDENYYIDLGIQGSACEAGTLYAHDGYLLMQGDEENLTGNLIIGTTSAVDGIQIRLISGGIEEDNVIVTFDSSNSHFLNNVIVDGTITGPTIDDINSYSNTSYATTNASFLTANSAGSFANGAFGRANNAAIYANGAFTKANTNSESITLINATLLGAQNFANGAFITSNNANIYANGAFAEANSAASYANGAFTKANNALANTSGVVFGGDLNVSGNVVASGIQSTTGAISTGNLIVNGTQSVTGTLNVAGIVAMNAQVVLTNTTFSSTQAALTIAASPTVVTPANDGYMIHISGKNGVASRVVTDSYGTGAYALYAGRSARGTVESPTALQSGDVISRFSSSGYGTTKYQTLGTGRIDFVASEDFTDANTGTQIKFWNCSVGSNTLTNILTLNGDSATFSGVVNPQKGFVYTPNVSGTTTTKTINFSDDNLLKFDVNDNATITLSNFVSGKVVEVWITNSAAQNKTITHGCLANNSTSKSTTFTITSGSSAYLRYFSIDGDQANTFVSITA